MCLVTLWDWPFIQEQPIASAFVTMKAPLPLLLLTSWLERCGKQLEIAEQLYVCPFGIIGPAMATPLKGPPIQDLPPPGGYPSVSH